MNPQDLLATSEHLIKAGATLGAALPFTALVKRMLGPAADEIAERVRDEVRIYRYGRQLSLLKKAEEMAAAAGFTPKAVPLKPLFALLEGASLEEDDNLHTMWAALLANASHPEPTVLVRPSFMDTLKLLPAKTATFMNAVYGIALERSGTVSGDSLTRRLSLVNIDSYEKLFALFAAVGSTSLPPDTVITYESSSEDQERDESDRMAFAVTMEELNRFRMWNTAESKSSGRRYYMSVYAVEFMMAVQPPANDRV